MEKEGRDRGMIFKYFVSVVKGAWSVLSLERVV